MMLTSSSEEQEADQLRLAVAESMCRTAEKRRKFQDAETAISFEMPMPTYYIYIYIADVLGRRARAAGPVPPAQTANRGVRRARGEGEKRGTNNGFVAIHDVVRRRVRGEQEDGQGEKPARLLFNGDNHYDALI